MCSAPCPTPASWTNTLIIYTSDNGFFHGEHRIRSEKVLPYWPAANVPLVMRGPGVLRGRRLKQLVANVDLAPTILEAAAAAPGRLQDGRSLLGLMSDPSLEVGREIVHENGAGVNSVPQYRALRNDRFLYVRHDTTGEYELYDLRKDPYELHNVEDVDEYAGVKRALSRRLRVLQRCAGEACFTPLPSVRLSARQLRTSNRPTSHRTLRGRRCVYRDVRLGITGADGRRMESVRYTVGRRKLGSSRAVPFFVKVKRSRLPSGRRISVRARVSARDGRVITVDRKLLTCRR